MSMITGSSCFNHKTSPSTHKCRSCLKPICDDCAMTSAGVTVCSEHCLEKVRLEAERAAEHARLEAEKAAATAKLDADNAALSLEEEFMMDDIDQTVKAQKILALVGLGCVLFFAWDYLPGVLTQNVEALFGKLFSSL